MFSDKLDPVLLTLALALPIAGCFQGDESSDPLLEGDTDGDAGDDAEGDDEGPADDTGPGADDGQPQDDGGEEDTGTDDGGEEDTGTDDGGEEDTGTDDGAEEDTDTDGDTGEPLDPVCGDGLAEGDEACDDAGESSSCNADCTLAVCGDGIVNVSAGEECEGAIAEGICDGNCLASCNAGFDDCNADLADGCEATLGSDQHCEACGDACFGGNSCFSIGCAHLENFYNDEPLGAFGSFPDHLFGYSVFLSDDSLLTSMSFITAGNGGQNAQLAIYDQNLDLVAQSGTTGPYVNTDVTTTIDIDVADQVLPEGAYWIVGLFDADSQLEVSPTFTFPNILVADRDFDQGFPATITNAEFLTTFAPNVYFTAAVP